MQPAQNPFPEVAIVVSWRERHGLTSQALAALARHTPTPHRLVVLDFGMPPALRAAVAARATQVVPVPDGTWPTEARARIAATLDTPFAVFMDNDVIVRPGWLEALLDCARATGAGIVSPLVLIGARADTDRIHFAGGDLHIQTGPEGTEMAESHRLAGARLAACAPTPRRARCDFAEYHCMLMRREVYAAPDMFDPRIHCVHEHVHAGLCARRLGYAVWVEPAARVAYLAAAPFRADELERFRWRWNAQAGERSIAAFCETWGVLDTERSFGGVRAFLRQHHARIDPLREDARAAPEARAPMPTAALCATLSDLLGLAAARGYTPDDLDAICRAWWEVLVLMDGGYRPCGRPFVNHLAGCAGVLIHYRFAVPMVVAALHHATYTHFPDPGAGRVKDLLAAVRAAARRASPAPDRRAGLLRAAARWLVALGGGRRRSHKTLAHAAATVLGGRGSPVEHLVRAYSLRAAPDPNEPVDSLDRVRVLMIAAANDIDMHLSGEVRSTGRADTLDAAARAQVRAACALLGVPGMAATLDALSEQAPPQAKAAASFRLHRGRRRPMVRRPALVPRLEAGATTEP